MTSGENGTRARRRCPARDIIFSYAITCDALRMPRGHFTPHAESRSSRRKATAQKPQRRRGTEKNGKTRDTRSREGRCGHGCPPPAFAEGESCRQKAQPRRRMRRGFYLGCARYMLWASFFSAKERREVPAWRRHAKTERVVTARQAHYLTRSRGGREESHYGLLSPVRAETRFEETTVFTPLHRPGTFLR